MVAAKPSTTADLRRVQQHMWDRSGPLPICRDCSLVFTDDIWLANMPGCPGPEFTLTFTGGSPHPPTVAPSMPAPQELADLIAATLEQHAPDNWVWGCVCGTMPASNHRDHGTDHRAHVTEHLTTVLTGARPTGVTP